MVALEILDEEVVLVVAEEILVAKVGFGGGRGGDFGRGRNRGAEN